MSDLVLQPVIDEATLRAWQSVEVAAWAADHEHLPADPIEDRRPLLSGEPTAGELRLLRLGVAAGVPVAAATLALPTLDNLASATVELNVHPEHRRRGHGRAMLQSLLGELADRGRRRIFFEVPSPWPEGEAPAAPLARELGARPVLNEVRRLLDLSRTLPAPIDPPAAYAVVQWVDRAPAELLDDLAALQARMSTDVPLGEMDWEPEPWDAARYLEKEASSIERGRVRIVTAVLHRDSGAVVGYTDIGVNATQPEVGYQWDTIVDPLHRGHGLGLVLKTHNARLLRERLPETRWVNTWNAESNTHMVAVNDALGFVPVGRWAEWQLDL